jgi:hypothetical protein
MHHTTWTIPTHETPRVPNHIRSSHVVSNSDTFNITLSFLISKAFQEDLLRMATPGHVSIIRPRRPQKNSSTDLQPGENMMSLRVVHLRPRSKASWPGHK